MYGPLLFLAPLFRFACIVAYLPYGFLSHSFFTVEFIHCCGAIVAWELCRMSNVLNSTSLFTPSETMGVAGCMWTVHSQKDNVRNTWCKLVVGMVLPGTSQVARKERTRTVICCCGCALVPMPVPVIWAPRRCGGFIGHRRRRSLLVNELKWSGAWTYSAWISDVCRYWATERVCHTVCKEVSRNVCIP